MMTETDPIVEAIFDAVARSRPRDPRRAPRSTRRERDGQPSGESVMAGDLYADELLADALTAVDGVGSFVSQERGPPSTPAAASARARTRSRSIPSTAPRISGRTNNAGTVVGVYTTRRSPATGRDLVAAGYVLYGPITTMIVADDDGVREEVVEGDGDGGVSFGRRGRPAAPRGPPRVRVRAGASPTGRTTSPPTPVRSKTS